MRGCACVCVCVCAGAQVCVRAPVRVYAGAAGLKTQPAAVQLSSEATKILARERARLFGQTSQAGLATIPAHQACLCCLRYTQKDEVCSKLTNCLLQGQPPQPPTPERFRQPQGDAVQRSADQARMLAELQTCVQATVTLRLPAPPPAALCAASPKAVCHPVASAPEQTEMDWLQGRHARFQDAQAAPQQPPQPALQQSAQERYQQQLAAYQQVSCMAAALGAQPWTAARLGNQDEQSQMFDLL